MRKIKEFLRPDWRKTSVFLLILLVNVILLMNLLVLDIVQFSFINLGISSIYPTHLMAEHLEQEHKINATETPWFTNKTEEIEEIFGPTSPLIKEPLPTLIPRDMMWIIMGWLPEVVYTSDTHSGIWSEYFFAPMHPLVSPLVPIAQLIASLLYIYVLSCVIVGIYDYLRKPMPTRRRKRR